jgi:hypothetical protein
MSSQERIRIYEIKERVCDLTFGSSPCTATGEPCYNTYVTCKDTPNYDETTQSNYFYTHSETMLVLPRAFPTVISADRMPLSLNIASADPNKQPLGERLKVQVTLQDHPYHDRVSDPYFRQRSYNAEAQGSYWARWHARNDHYEGTEVVEYDGYVGQELNAMRKTHLQLERIDGPGSSMAVQLNLTDILKRCDNDRVKIPRVSTGTLLNDIDNVETSFTLTTSGDGASYATSGSLSIGDEKMTFTRSGDVFTVVRGVDGSEAKSHRAGAAVQQALVIDDERIDDLLEDWLVEKVENLPGGVVQYVGIPSDWIPKAEWAQEVDEWIPTAIINRTIYKPEGANQLIGELLRDCGCYLVPDLVEQKIYLRAIRETEVSASLTDRENIISGSFSVKRRPDIRISQLWFSYDARNDLGPFNDKANFNRLLVTFAPDATRFQQQQIKEIRSRFLTRVNASIAQTTSTRIVTRYSIDPREFTFALDWEDGKNLRLGDVVVLTHRELVDVTGAPVPTGVQIISIRENGVGSQIEYTAQPFAFKFYARRIAPNDLPVWTESDEAQRARYMYISNNDGNMSDGAETPLIPL